MPCSDEKIGSQMILYGLGKLDAVERKAFEDHLWTCPHCTERWYEMQPYVAEIGENPEAWRQHLRAAVAEKEAATRRRERKTLASFFAGLRLFRPAWSLAVTLLLSVGLAVGWFFYSGQEPALHPPSTGVRSPVHLLEPLGSIDRVPQVFRWEPVAGARSYRIKIRDDSTGSAVAARTTEPQSRPPSASGLSLQAGRSYSWTVEALDEKDQVIGTSEGYFKLVR